MPFCIRLPRQCSAECAPAFIALAEDCYDQAHLANVEGADAFLEQCNEAQQSTIQGAVDGAPGSCDCAAQLGQVNSRLDTLERGHTTQHGPQADERLACSCSLCADTPIGSDRCLPWTEDPHWPA
eukprot:SAG31_NODE_19101_length_612_cov_0.927875_2_plen_124_part_01